MPAVTAIPDWNVIVTVQPGEFRHARRLLEEIAPVAATGYYNVLVMKVADAQAFLRQLSALARDRPMLHDVVAHVAPATRTFDYASGEVFERKARDVVVEWAPALAGLSFFVRMHRRGPGVDRSSQEEERLLDTAILETLTADGTPGRICFEDPDAVIDVQTLDSRAGLALWTREDLRLCPFLWKR